MKVTLNKNIQLHSALAYIRFHKEEERKDIQDYLNGKKHFESFIENRIKDYLKNIGVYDEHYQITSYGNTVKETGKMVVAEEGKYQIWYTNKDSFFGNKIIYFKRLQPNAKDDIRNEIILDLKGHFRLPTYESNYTKLKLATTPLFGNIFNSNEQLHLSWVWDNLEKSNYIFTGQLGKQENNTKILSEAIPSDKNIQKIIGEILPEWNNEQKKHRIRFEELSDQSKKTFEDKNFVSKWNDFEVQIQNLPLMPYDKAEAKKWRNWLLTEELKEDFFNPADFEETATELNTIEALASYDLDVPKPKDFIKKVEFKNVFWHLNAPIDLNPNNKIKLPSKPIELKNGEHLSFNDIVRKLGLDNIDKNSVLVYYDRYVINEFQQMAVAILLKSINCSKRFLITDLSPKENSSNYIQKQHTDIKIINYKDIFKSRKPHDRYLITGNIKDEMTIWNISNSINYISFSDNNFDTNTNGTIRQSVVFTPISKNMLDNDFLNLINNEIKNVK